MSQSTEIHESQPTNELEGLIERLTVDQIRFVVARQEHNTDKEAAEDLGISPDTVKSWKRKDIPIDRACALLASDGLIVATNIRRRNLSKAMLVKVTGLDSEDERLRQGVATEIIEWEMGRAKQGVEHSGTGEGGAIVVDDSRAEYHSRAIASLADAVRTLLASDHSGEPGAMDAPE